MFVDHIKIHAKAGDGGNGSVSFRREAFVPKGGPDGGDGGKGGDVILQVDPHTDNLTSLFYRTHYKAERGVHGKGRRMSGRAGKNLVLKVPAGTLIHRAEPPKPKKKKLDDEWEGDFEKEAEAEELSDDEEIAEIDNLGEPFADLTEPGEKFVLCRGGIGGKGNQHFATSTNQAPIETKPAEPGEEGWYYLELRRIADAGLVGFPNAGKSTLLRALSNASPKVAAYPFTTLKPMVGIVEFPGFKRASVADIPGLIEGAHKNVGLGHEFLRHIMRCQLLIFVVDTAGVDGRDPIRDLEKLRTEIKLYDEELSKRPWLIIANKLDLEAAQETIEALKYRFSRQEVIPISAETGEGIEALKDRLEELIANRPK